MAYQSLFFFGTIVSINEQKLCHAFENALDNQKRKVYITQVFEMECCAMAINTEDVKKVAKLAKLEFRPEEMELIARQLDEIVGYVEKLNELDTSSVEPTSHVLDLKNVFREDTVFDWITPEEALMNAPVRNQQYFSVPKVIG